MEEVRPATVVAAADLNSIEYRLVCLAKYFLHRDESHPDFEKTLATKALLLERYSEENRENAWALFVKRARGYDGYILPKDVLEYLVLRWLSLEDAKNFAIAYSDNQPIRFTYIKKELIENPIKFNDPRFDAVRGYCRQLINVSQKRRESQLAFILERLQNRDEIDNSVVGIDRELKKNINVLVKLEFSSYSSESEHAMYKILMSDIRSLMLADAPIVDVDLPHVKRCAEIKCNIKGIGGIIVLFSGIIELSWGIAFLTDNPPTQAGKILIGVGATSIVLPAALFADRCCGIRFHAQNFARSLCGFFTRPRDPERTPLLINENNENAENRMERGESVSDQQITPRK